MGKCSQWRQPYWRNLFCCLIFLVQMVDLLADPTLVNFAGMDNNAGYSGDGIATSNYLYYPQALWLDSPSNMLYIADTNNNRIRKIDMDTNIMTTVAGDEKSALMGDDGPATRSSLRYPEGVSLDIQGNIYIADAGNHRIRKIQRDTNFISSIVGYGLRGQRFGISGDNGPATSATIYDVRYLTGDSVGNLYYSEYSSWIVRKISRSTGIIRRFAGTGSSSFYNGYAATSSGLYYPNGMFVDSIGSVYIIETERSTIRKVDAYGITSTFAGVSSGFNGDGYVATSTYFYYPRGIWGDSMGTMYIADTNNYLIRKIDSSTRIVSTIAGQKSCSGSVSSGSSATSACISYVQYITGDTNGAIYYSDTSNYRVMKIASGIITFFAGNGGSSYYGDGYAATSNGIYYPSGLWVNSIGDLYVSSYHGHRVFKVIASTGQLYAAAGIQYSAGLTGDGGPGTSAQLYYPQGLWGDSNGNLFIADYENGRIRQLSVDGIIKTIAGSGGIGVSGSSSDGEYGTSASINYPTTVVSDTGGTIYFTELNNNYVRKLINGKIFTVAGGGSNYASYGNWLEGTSALINSPSGLWLDSVGSLFITSRSYVIYKVESTSITPMITLFAGIEGDSLLAGDGEKVDYARFGELRGIWGDTAGNLLVADTGNGRIRRIDGVDRIVSTAAGYGLYSVSRTPNRDNSPATQSYIREPYAMVGDGNGNIYFADYSTYRVHSINLQSGAMTTILGNGGYGSASSYHGVFGTNVSISYAFGLSFYNGFLYIAISDSCVIAKLDVSNNYMYEIAGKTTGCGFSGDDGVAFDAALSYPRGVWVDSIGTVYIADTSNNRIRKVDPNSGYIYTIAGNGNGGLCSDTSAVDACLGYIEHIIGDSDGVLYFSDEYNVIHKLQDGYLTNFIGTGNYGYNGDYLSATATYLRYPKEMAFATAGN